MSPLADAVSGHYARPDLLASVQAALAAAGKADGTLTPEDLAPIDQFHSRGRDATRELGRLAGVTPGVHVLDVGGGIGGAARLLARDFGGRVTVVDLTEEYCRVGAWLTERAGLADRVEFRHGDALALPVADGAVDVAWTQHSSMNVADKAALFRELARVVRPGGRVAIHEIGAGAGGPPHFPVPWAREPAWSFLEPAAALRAHAAAAGLREQTWTDTTAESLAWFGGHTRPPARPLGLHVLLGDEFRTMFANQVRNLAEDRIRVVLGVWSRD